MKINKRFANFRGIFAKFSQIFANFRKLFATFGARNGSKMIQNDPKRRKMGRMVRNGAKTMHNGAKAEIIIPDRHVIKSFLWGGSAPPDLPACRHPVRWEGWREALPLNHSLLRKKNGRADGGRPIRTERVPNLSRTGPEPVPDPGLDLPKLGNTISETPLIHNIQNFFQKHQTSWISVSKLAIDP